MSAKPKAKPVTFDAFARMMGQALKLGRKHRLARQDQATPLELAVALKVPGEDARSLHVLYLRESYLAGYNFTDRN